MGEKVFLIVEAGKRYPHVYRLEEEEKAKKVWKDLKKQRMEVFMSGESITETDSDSDFFATVIEEYDPIYKVRTYEKC